LALFKSLVRPNLEYCIPVWNPYLVKDEKLIAGIQQQATRMIQGIQHRKYDNRLNCLGLIHLERRRVISKTFKIMKWMYDVSKEKFLKFDDSGTRGQWDMTK